MQALSPFMGVVCKNASSWCSTLKLTLSHVLVARSQTKLKTRQKKKFDCLGPQLLRVNSDILEECIVFD